MNSCALELPRCCSQRVKARGPLWILVCGGVVSLLMGLVGLRLYSLNLEYQLADIQRQIVLMEEEQSRLEKDLAGLLNPTRVYSYARSELGMKASAGIGVVGSRRSGRFLRRARRTIGSKRASSGRPSCGWWIPCRGRLPPDSDRKLINEGRSVLDERSEEEPLAAACRFHFGAPLPTLYTSP